MTRAEQRRRRYRWRTATTLGAAVAIAASAGVYATATTDAPRPTPAAKAPNIVYFLVDDMSSELLKYADTISGLADGGTTFANYYVSNSLCCPSRASMFTGEFPHVTGVETNKGSDRGGYPAFRKHESRTYATALHGRGYHTGYLGKYINEYKVDPEKGKYQVPPGWDEWHVAGGGGYNEYKYQITRYIPALNTGKEIGGGGGEYLVDKLGERATKFLDRSRKSAAEKPFFLQVAPFSPHSRAGKDDKKPRFPPAIRDRAPNGKNGNGDCGPGRDCAGIDVSTLPAYNEQDVSDKPKWISSMKPLGQRPKHPNLPTELRNDFQNRVRMMQSLDDMVEKVLNALTAEERANTYIMFGSDNGFHLGQHRLARGKTTAYEHDIRVPFLVKRPAGQRETIVSDQIAQNVDIHATLVDIANGAEPGPADRNGRSLLPLINGERPADWRNAALVEHVRPDPDAPGFDPDRQAGGAPSYRAVRTTHELYVEYKGGFREYYDMRKTPHQTQNDPNNPRVSELAPQLDRLARCGTNGTGCWTAAHFR